MSDHAAPANPSPLRVLLIEDSEDDAALILHALRRGGYEPQAERVQDEATLRAALQRGPWDVVLSDHCMPQFESMDALRLVREHDPDLPFIIVSGSIGEELAVHAMRAGAHDFVMKDQPGRLAPAIERERRDAEIRRARRRAEEALRLSETRYRELVEELPAVTYIAGLDDNRPVFFISRQIEALLGQDARDHRHLWRDCIHPDDRARVRTELAAARERAGSFVCEYRLQRSDGRSVWIQDHGLVVTDQQGVAAFMRGFMLDITERKQAELALQQREEQLRQSQKLEAIGRLAGGVAHDFNNLLTPILGYGRLLQQDLADHPEHGLFVEEMVRAAERAAKLTRQLLTFSRHRPEERKAWDLNVVLTDLHRFLRRTLGEDVELVSLLSEEPVVVEADRTNLEQVIMNLAVNARDAMPRGGRLTIRTVATTFTPEQGGRSGVAPGEYVLLSVRDTGTGMTADVREHLFEPFFTTKAEGHGTGLGLSIIYGIVKQGGGHIEVDTEPGQGSEFRVYLPRLPSHLATPEPARAAPAPGGQETLLLVEDEDAVRDLAQHLLLSLGYRVLTAASGTEALAVWSRHEGEVQALVSDLVMPHMGGRELAAALRARRPGLPVLFISGFVREGGPVGPEFEAPILMKPFARDDLARAVRQVLDAS
jgi:PAS domain S-box-containing protein